MEFFVCIGILVFIKLIEWSWKLFAFSFKLMWGFLTLPFRCFSKPGKAVRQKPYQAKCYQDPIEKAIDHWDNSPKDLDMEDMFWLDELMGDD